MSYADCYFIAGVLVMDMILWNKRGITNRLGRSITRMTSWHRHLLSCLHPSMCACMHSATVTCALLRRMYRHYTKIISLRVMTRKHHHAERWMGLNQQIGRTWSIFLKNLSPLSTITPATTTGLPSHSSPFPSSPSYWHSHLPWIPPPCPQIQPPPAGSSARKIAAASICWDRFSRTSIPRRGGKTFPP